MSGTSKRAQCNRRGGQVRLDDIADPVLVLLGELGIDGEREDPLRKGLGDREVSPAKPMPGIGGLEVEGLQ